MPTFYLIRHGQVSFMQANYDVLSPLGVEQSEILGKYLLANNYQFDACLTGVALSWRLTEKEKESIKRTIYELRNQFSIRQLGKLLE